MITETRNGTQRKEVNVMTRLEEAIAYVERRVVYGDEPLKEIINDACNIFSKSYDEYMELYNALTN